MENEDIFDMREDLQGRKKPTAKVLAGFLLENVIPTKYNTFREFMTRISDTVMPVFVTEVRRWVLKNCQPKDRAEIYKKLDAIPTEMAGPDPLGYHIVTSFDRYASAYYNRSLTEAEVMRKHHLTDWEKFKADWKTRKVAIIKSPCIYDDIKPASPNMTLKVIKDTPVAPVPVEKGSGKLKRYTEEELIAFLRMKLVEKKLGKQIAKIMGINYERVAGLNSRWSHGYLKLEEKKMWAMERAKPHRVDEPQPSVEKVLAKAVSVPTPVGQKALKEGDGVHHVWTEDEIKIYIRMKVFEKRERSEIAKALNVNNKRIAGLGSQLHSERFKRIKREIGNEIGYAWKKKQTKSMPIQAPPVEIADISQDRVGNPTPSIGMAIANFATEADDLRENQRQMTQLLQSMVNSLTLINRRLTKLESKR